MIRSCESPRPSSRPGHSGCGTACAGTMATKSSRCLAGVGVDSEVAPVAGAAGVRAPLGEGRHMAQGSLGKLLRRTLLRLTGAAATPDAQLLGRFVAEHDEAAFAELVQRHGPMVYQVCLRVLHH